MSPQRYARRRAQDIAARVRAARPDVRVVLLGTAVHAIPTDGRPSFWTDGLYVNHGSGEKLAAPPVSGPHKRRESLVRALLAALPPWMPPVEDVDELAGPLASW